jgi:transporter family-2 protein
MSLLPFIYAILAGIFTTLEASINAKLGRMISPNIATLHSLVTGALIILAANFFRGTINQYSKIIYINPRWLIGGIFGTCIVYFATKTIPKLGISNTLTIIVASQVISSFFIDAVLLKQDFRIDKILGAAMLLISVYFILR